MAEIIQDSLFFIDFISPLIVRANKKFCLGLMDATVAWDVEVLPKNAYEVPRQESK